MLHNLQSTLYLTGADNDDQPLFAANTSIGGISVSFALLFNLT